MSSTAPAVFRRTLARELPAWRADGLLDERASLALTARYGLDALTEPDDRWVVRTFALLGAVAIGAGTLSFVAAHWQEIGAAARFAIVAAAAIIAYGLGAVLRSRGNALFADAAFVAGSLAFGGAIALGAQEFNASLELWQVYALWAAGLMPLAFALRSVPVACVALASGAVSVPMHAFQAPGEAAPVVHLLIVAAVAAVLARQIGVLWFRELALALAALGAFIVLATGDSFDALRIALAAVAALGLAAGAARSAFVARAATVIAFAVALPSTFWWAYGTHSLEKEHAGVGIASAALLAAMAVAVWYVRRRDLVLVAPPAAMLAAAIVLPHVPGITPIAGVLLANGLVLGVAATMIVRGLALRERAAFLGGTAVAAFTGFLRFAEYDHDLTRKALAFVAVGIAFIVAARLYERGRSASEVSHAA